MKNRKIIYTAMFVIVVLLFFYLTIGHTIQTEQSPTINTNTMPSPEAVRGPAVAPLFEVVKVEKVDGQKIFYKSMGGSDKEGYIEVLTDTKIIKSADSKVFTPVNKSLSDIKPAQIIEITFSLSGTQVDRIVILE